MKPVLVNIKSIQRDINGEEVKIELLSEGKFYVKDNARYIVYEESEITDMKGVTTIIKILPDGAVVLIRMGSLEQRQEYRKGQTTHARYKTSIGEMWIGVTTYECQVDLTDGIGSIRLGYDVELDGIGSNYTQLIITVQEDHCNGNKRIANTGDC